MRFDKTRNLYRLSLLLLLLGGTTAYAEPYLAVQEGFKCSQCHVNPTGGGLRNVFGNAYAQAQLAANRVDVGDSAWTGMIGQFLAIGGNFRADLTETDVPNNPRTNDFQVEQGRVYFNFGVIPNRLSIYFDELFAPGGASNREAYVRYQFNNEWSIKGGQMYLPFGFRLQDDSSFVRQVSEISMSTPDNGVEVSWETGPWSTQFAISNGTAGGPETDTGKQYSLQGSYVQRNWRAGLAANFNDRSVGDRSVVGLFGGLKTGPVAWLTELDFIDDKSLTGGTGNSGRKMVAGFIEGNWRMRQGHNLKITFDQYDPDRDVSHDGQSRISAVYEYTPIQYLQLRFGYRHYDGIAQNDFQNRRLAFVELHGFF